MKTISIGDIHGLFVIDKILEIINLYDKIIFVGDYVDSFTIDDQTILLNLNEIIDLKKKRPYKIILLWGNHDIQYLLGYERHGCSGYRPKMKEALYELFKINRNLFSVSYQLEDTLWTHAGISKYWYENRFKKFRDANPKLTISQQLNLAFEQLEESLFDVGYSRGGHHRVGGPFWCDMAELKAGPIRTHHQIVGHTKIPYIQRLNLHNKELAFIDVLDSEENIRTSLFYEKII
jgi:hypothetical protein